MWDRARDLRESTPLAFCASQSWTPHRHADGIGLSRARRLAVPPATAGARCSATGGTRLAVPRPTCKPRAKTTTRPRRVTVAGGASMLRRWNHMGMRIDLHMHSAASDGTDTPACLISNAHSAGLAVVALSR